MGFLFYDNYVLKLLLVYDLSDPVSPHNDDLSKLVH